jgi:hypothetical protein
MFMRKTLRRTTRGAEIIHEAAHAARPFAAALQSAPTGADAHSTLELRDR